MAIGWQGAYARCVAMAARDFDQAGLVSTDEHDQVVTDAGESDFGK